MPAKNSIKIYLEGGYYHVYNRGVEKRKIFKDDQDYRVFLDYLKIYLLPEQEASIKSVSINGFTFQRFVRPLNNFWGEVELLAYCLMPNHFHLLLKQKSPRSIEAFMRSLGTKYSGYFNKRYERVGPLFQSVYKAVLVQNEEQLLHLTRYIHLNPVKESPLQLFDHYSSYGEYLGLRKTEWVKTDEILAFFKSPQRTNLKDILSYQSFVEDYLAELAEIIHDIAIDNEDM